MKRRGLLSVNRPLLRFRRTVRLIIILLRSGGVLKSVKSNNNSNGQFARVLREKSFSNKTMIKSGDQTIFNPNIFKQEQRLNILQTVKSFLKVPPKLRLLEPEMIKTSLRSLQVFDPISTFTLEIQQKIVECSYLEDFGAGRILLQEGHRPERYYVILQGQALRARSIAGASLSVIGVFSAGSCVGDENNCLYLGDKREDSFFVKDYVSALVLSRKDYLAIFHRPQQLPEVQKFLSSQPYFQNWPIKKLDETQIFTKYYRNGIIISDGSEMPRLIHFLKSGQAQIIRQVESNQEKSFVVAKEMIDGDCFGMDARFGTLSEKKNDKYLVSRGCEIITIKANHFIEFSTLMVNVNLQLIEEKTALLTAKDASGHLEVRHSWENYKKCILNRALNDIQLKR